MRFSKPFTVTLAGAALLALPLSGTALADAPKPAATAPAPAKHEKQDTELRRVSLSVAVDPARVRAGQTYGVTILVKGQTSGTATVTSPEGKSYRVGLSGGRATMRLTVPSRAKAGTQKVTVKIGGRTATASFTVVAPRPREDDDRRHRAAE
ncbi:hypothetical protein AB0K40_42320 [Nonomuraea bangladeshensis]|uniref:Carboxypeptidase regulatory-like domain-containing protein n=1 Tax=Nonomuraea bangladeshensis TaxID=404385 RepID=A0ABV3HI20_9ACTN